MDARLPPVYAEPGTAQLLPSPRLADAAVQQM